MAVRPVVDPAAEAMARGYAAEPTDIQLMEQGVCHVVQGRTISQRATYARRVAAASLMLLLAVVACAALAGSTSSGKSLAESQLYSATGWDAIYGGKGAGKSSDGWGDDSGEDNTGAITDSLHQSDDDSDDSDVDPDSAKNDVHWNAADGNTPKKATTTSDDDTDDSSTDSSKSQKKAKSSAGSSSKKAATQKQAKKGKPDATDALVNLSKSFDKGLPTPKSRAEEKKQKAEQLANLLRIQKELSSDYKKVMAKGTSVKSVGKKMGLMKKATHTARLGGDPFDV